MEKVNAKEMDDSVNNIVLLARGARLTEDERIQINKDVGLFAFLVSEQKERQAKQEKKNDEKPEAG